MKKFLIVILVSVFSFNTFADCLPAYQSKIQRLNGWLGPLAGGAINEAVGVTATQIAVAATGTALTVATLATAGAGAVATAGLYGVVSLKKKSYSKVVRLLQEANLKGHAYELKKMARYLSRKENVDVDYKEIADLIVRANNNDILCSYSEYKDQYKVMSYIQVRRYIKAELGL